MASVLYIAEFAEVEIGPAGRVGQFAAQPTLAEQTITVGAGSTPSAAAFNASTRFVRLHNDTGGACSIVFGTAPVATATNARMAANQTEYFGVPKGQAFKVAAIANT